MSTSAKTDAQRLTNALREELYVVAAYRDRLTVAVTNDLGEDYVRAHVERATEGHDVLFTVEHAGVYDEHNDQWRIRVADS